MAYEQELSPLGRRVSEVLNNIVRRAVNSAGETTAHQIDVPGDFVNVSEPQQFFYPKEQNYGASEWQSLYGQDGRSYFVHERCIGWQIDIQVDRQIDLLKNEPEATRAVLFFMNGKDEVIKALAQNNSDRLLKEFRPKKLQPEDVSVKTLIDEENRQKIITQFAQEIECLCQEISAFERDWDVARNRYNVATDRSFGEWLQRFLIFAEKNPDDRDIQRLHDDLFAVLAPMGIKVYDDAALKEGRLKADGTPDVPVQEYLIDNRQGASYNRVSRPAIYSDAQVLARGAVS